jgi:hypothetical protein
MGLQLYVLAQQGQLRLQVPAGKASCDSHGHRDQESCGSDGPRGGAERVSANGDCCSLTRSFMSYSCSKPTVPLDGIE